MSRTMVYRRREAHVVVVHTREPPSDAEWEAYVRDTERWLEEVVGYLIVTEGGGPSAAERRMMRDMQQRREMPTVRTAVVCDSLLTRGIVKALGLFNAKIQAFRPEAVRDALVHIGAALHADELLAELELLRERLRQDVGPASSMQ